MSLAEDLRNVLRDAAAVLRRKGTHDTATMAEQAAGILDGHVATSPAELHEYAAVSLVDHLFRGSAAAGAIQSMPAPAPAAPAPAPPAPAVKPAAPAPAPRPPAPPASANPSKETT